MENNGICAIKPEYIINNGSWQKEEVKVEVVENGDEPDTKKPRLSKQEKKKNRGQNKARPVPFKVDFKTEICNQLRNVDPSSPFPECTKSNCIYLHDVEQYLKSKPADISDKCYNFEMQGQCCRGLACRFGKSHLTPDGKNIRNEEIASKYENKTTNALPMELQNQLRKRMYDFDKSEKLVKKCDADKNSLDEDRGEKKVIDWKDKLFLSPLTTVGNLPFRRICKEYGADITCGEMAMDISILQASPAEWALIKRHKSEDIFGVQLCGSSPYTLTKAAQLLQENVEIDFIDLNLGCPIDLVFQKGAGSALLRRQKCLETIIRCMSTTLKIPLTIKTRTGVYENKEIAHDLIPKFRDWGASMCTFHGRSREQRYTRSANWEYINKCAGLASPMPVFGNGDILSYEDYKYARETYPNVSGVTIGRGALIKPWIFTEIKEQRLWDIRSSERFDILKKYANYGLEHWSSDTKGVESTRRFMLEWLSFLYRYVPVGVLERPPQKINERPPCFVGRDDLETLMASPNCEDWIKISEMLLGPVPDGFKFLPKHKANSYTN